MTSRRKAVEMGVTVLIDALNLAYRSYYAFSNLKDELGRPTGTYFGFLRTLLPLKRRFGGNIIVCWDAGVPGSARVPNWRKAIYPPYKATRKWSEAYEVVGKQLEHLARLVDLIGLRNAGLPGLEADDVMGLLATEVTGRVLLYTTDRDLYQLLENSRVQIIQPNRTQTLGSLVTRRKVEQEYGIPVRLWGDYLALGGDCSDNIRPLPGKGPKSAAQMVKGGVRAGLDFDEQPLWLRRKSAALRERWTAVQAAYKVVLIPRDKRDARIVHLAGGKRLIQAGSCQGLDRERRSWLFVQFCARYDLRLFIAQRKEFVL